jgi:hypothetical protein
VKNSNASAREVPSDTPEKGDETPRAAFGVESSPFGEHPGVSQLIWNDRERLSNEAMTNGVSSKWRPALSLFGTPARPRGFADEALWLGRSGWVSANIRLPAKPSLVVLSVKSAPLASWWAGPLPPDIGLIYLPFPADPRGSMVIRKVLPRDIPVVFVGDLDPPSIVQYVATRSGLPPATRKRL